MRPHRWQPTGFPRPWGSPGKNTGVGCHFLLQCMKVKSESEVTQLCPTLGTPWTAAHQAPPSMGFSRRSYFKVNERDYWHFVTLWLSCYYIGLYNLFVHHFFSPICKMEILRIYSDPVSETSGIWLHIYAFSYTRDCQPWLHRSRHGELCPSPEILSVLCDHLS